MIGLIITIGWLLGSLSAYRRIAYTWNESMMDTHEFQLICDTCRCYNCGNAKEYHSKGKRYSFYGCDNYMPRVRMHISPLLLSIPLSMIVWLPFWTYYAGAAVKTKLNLETRPFFLPSPVIESREVKRERRLKELEAENARLEKELGIGTRN